MELLEQILGNQNMNEAYLRVYKNKGASGIDGVTVEELKQYLRENKDELRQRTLFRKNYIIYGCFMKAIGIYFSSFVTGNRIR